MSTIPSQQLSPNISISNMLTPPPLSTITTSVNDDDTRNIPGEIQLDPHGKLLKKFLVYDGFATDIIESYNTALDQIVKRIEAERILLHDRSIITFKDVKFLTPQNTAVTDISKAVQYGGSRIFHSPNESSILTPLVARRNMLTYNTHMYVTINIAPSNGAQPITYYNELVGSMPAMLGSKVCYLGNLVNQGDKRNYYGECENDPFGYFIINGMEYIILLIEKLRMNRIFVTPTKKELVCKMTCATLMGTSIVNITMDPLTYIVRVELKFTRKDMINIFIIAYVLSDYKLDGGKGVDKATFADAIIRHILTFVKDETPNKTKLQKIAMTLQTSKDNFINTNDNIYVYLKNRLKNSVTIIDENKRNEEISNVNLKNPKDIRDDIITDMFPQMPYNPNASSQQDGAEQHACVNNKLGLFCIMVAMFLETYLGYRQPDDRDNWSNKRISTPGSTFYGFFARLWKSYLGKILLPKRGVKGGKPAVSKYTDNFRKLFKKEFNEMSAAFGSAFTTNNWGVAGGKRIEHVSEPLKRDTLIATYSHIGRIITPVNRKTKNPRTRMIEGSQTGYVCFGESPEGAVCGLVKNKAVTCMATSDADDSLILKFFYDNQLIRDGPDIINNSVCILNGDFLGWCNGQYLHRILINKRRNIPFDETGRLSGPIKADTCIVFDNTINILYVYTDGGRLVRPLLVVDNDGKLVIDKPISVTNDEGKIVVKPNAWGETWDVLLKNGCIEYIDAWEQHYAYIAMNKNLIDSQVADIEGCVNSLAQNRLALAQLNQTNIRNDVDNLERVVATLRYDIELIENTIRYFTIDRFTKEKYELLNADVEKLEAHRLSFAGSAERQVVIDADLIPKRNERDSLKPVYDSIIQRINSGRFYGNITSIYEYFMLERKLAEKRIRLKESEMLLSSLRQGKVQVDPQFIADKDTIMKRISNDEYTLRKLLSKGNNGYYTHCEADPSAIWGIAASSIPYANHNPGARIAFACGMIKQALGNPASNHIYRVDTTSKTLAYPSRPLVETQMYREIGLDNLPAGQTVMTAIMTYGGYNQEDGIIVSKRFVEMGMRIIVTKTITCSIKKNSQPPKGVTISHAFKNPMLVEKLSKVDPITRRHYRNIDENGRPKLNSLIEKGDCIVGRVTTVNGQEDINTSRMSGIGEEGIVERIIETSQVIRVKLRVTRSLLEGDKMASRHAQKSVIVKILPTEDMPYTDKGIIPDIIMNPLSIPSRMTVGHLMEIIASKAASFRGERYNASSFRDFDLDDFRRTLITYGHNPTGKEKLYSGFTGDPINAEIFMGPIYYQALKHHVYDKFQASPSGPIKPDTQQPAGGRKSGGSIRFGEQERDALIAHGAAYLLNEMFCHSSDPYTVTLCKKCYSMVAPDVSVQPPITYCRICRTDVKTHPGQFARVPIPFTYIHYNNLLAGMGIRGIFKV